MSTMTLHDSFHTVTEILREDNLTVSTCFAEGRIYRAMPPREAQLTHGNLRALIRRVMAQQGYAVKFLTEFHDLPYSGFDISIEFTYHADLLVNRAPQDESHEQKALF